MKTPQIAAPHSQDMAERGQEESESENAYPPKKFGPFAAVVCSFARSADSHLRWASERGKTSPLNQRAAASLRLPNAVMTSHDIVEAGENRPSPPCGLSHSVRSHSSKQSAESFALVCKRGQSSVDRIERAMSVAEDKCVPTPRQASSAALSAHSQPVAFALSARRDD